MKTLKRFLVVTMSMCMTIGLIMTPIHAEEIIKPVYIENGQLYNTKENVYDSLLKQVTNASKDMDTFSMLNEEQLNTIKAIYDLKDSIFKLKEKSEPELISMGYTGDQLYAIENYDGSDSMTRAAVPTIYSSANYSISNYGSYSFYNVYASFEYVGTYVGYLYVNNNYGITSAPYIGGSSTTPAAPNSYSSTIDYNYYIGSSKYTTSRSATSVSREKGACMFSFPVGVDVSGTRGYVTSGSFSIQCKVSSNISSVSGYCGYIYTTADRKSDFLATAGAIWYSIFTNDVIGTILSFVNFQNDAITLAGIRF
ncbi:MAG: hypothetical protein ACLRVU_01495 [Beduini sp.]|uniref:hypothetical protein n=1 Tax=Beduini sp. TaxID=1922300 RepID=UPI0039A1698E